MRPSATTRLAALATLAVLLAAPATAQSPLVIEPGINSIPNAINGDTNPPDDRVYILRRGERYLYTEQLVTTRPVVIEAEEGDDPRPIIQANFDPSAEEGNRPFRPEADFTIRGVYIYGFDTAGRVTDNAMIRVGGDGARLVIDDCHFDGNRAGPLRFDNDGTSLFMTNSVLSNAIRPPNRGIGQAIRTQEIQMDSLVIRNSTIYNTSDYVIFQFGVIDYVELSHVTVYGVGREQPFRSPIDVGQAREFVFTDNVLYNYELAGTPEGFAEDGFVGYAISADSVTVNEAGDKVAPEIVFRNANVYQDEAIYDALPDSVLAAPSAFDETIQAVFDAGTGGADTFISEALDFVTPPDIQKYIDRMAFYYENLTWEGAPPYPLEGREESPAVPPDPQLPVDFAYSTSATSYTASTGGCPLGDLNWFRNDPNVDVAACLAASLQATPAEGGPSAAFGLRVAPNPATSVVALLVDLDAAAAVTVTVYDMLGREVASREADLGAGAGQRLGLDVSDVPSGVYVVRVQADAGGTLRQATRRLTVVR
jgi:hypothetical protein